MYWTSDFLGGNFGLFPLVSENQNRGEKMNISQPHLWMPKKREEEADRSWKAWNPKLF